MAVKPPVTGLGTNFGLGGGIVSVMVTQLRRRVRRAHLYITEWMEFRGLSDQTLGDRVELPRQTIFRWRKEQHRLDPGKIALLASALDCEPEELWRPPDSGPSLDAAAVGLDLEERQKVAEDIHFLKRRRM